MNKGEITAKIGAVLAERLQQDYDVFFDHGDATPMGNVRACLALLSEQPRNATRVADVDIVICSKHGHSPVVKAILEVEESGFSPKTILGDVMSLMLAKAIAIKTDEGGHRVYRVDDRTTRHVFGVVKSKGSKSEQIEDFLLPQLKQALAPGGRDQLPIIKILNERDDLGKAVLEDIEETIRTL